jgi:hypothetical protein
MRYAAGENRVKRPGPISEATPNAADIRTALERLIASPAFTKSPQLAHFLSFVVEETLAGRGDRIKAYTIAADALGRDASFDPQNDPIVRVEAGRLRRALEHYYASDGRNDPIVIAMPRGHYVPIFRMNTARRRAIARMHGLRGQFADALRDNYRLVLLIVVIAAIVCLTIEVLERTIWSEPEYALRDSFPAISAPDATGGLKR